MFIDKEKLVEVFPIFGKIFTKPIVNSYSGTRFKRFLASNDRLLGRKSLSWESLRFEVHFGVFIGFEADEIKNYRFLCASVYTPPEPEVVADRRNARKREGFEFVSNFVEFGSFFLEI